MSVYAVALIKIQDRDAYRRYEAGFSPVFAKHRGEILAVEEAPRVIEGDWPYTRTVIIRFPTEDDFQAWYHSPEYQEIAKHRFQGSSAQLAVLTGREPSTTKPKAEVTFASVTASDFDELADLRVAAMRESLERVGRFDPERARERLRKSFCPEHTQAILHAGARVGFFTFRPTEEGFQLDHLYVHPFAQSHGIGSRVMEELIARANAANLPIRVGALKESASNRFYRRHGFQPEREDTWDVYYVRPCTGRAR